MKKKNELKRAAELIQKLIVDSNQTPEEFLKRLRHRENALGVNAPRLREWLADDQTWKSTNPIVASAQFSRTSSSLLPSQWASIRLGGRFVPGKSHYVGHKRFSDLYIDARKKVNELRGKIEHSIFNDFSIDGKEAIDISLSWMKFCLWADGVVSLMNEKAFRGLDQSVERLHRAPADVASHLCVRDALDSSSLCPQTIAEKCGFKKAPSVNKWGEESGRIVSEYCGNIIYDTKKKSGIPNPFDYLVRVSEITNDSRPVALMCSLLDGRLVEGPPVVDVTLTDLSKSWVRVDTEIAEFMSSIGRAVEDEKLEANEIDRITREWLEVRMWMETFAQACGEGAFLGTAAIR